MDTFNLWPTYERKHLFVPATHKPPARKNTPAEPPLERMLDRIRHNDDFPSVSKYITEINKKLSSNPESSDASELANLILNDYALTSKLLKLANSVTFGFAAGKVTTVTRAVVILGYEYVRMTTISLSLFEHLSGGANATDLKEELICSLWSGMIAREIALNEEGVDPEEAFVAAMMSRFGKLVMIRYLPGEYRKACDYMREHGCSEHRAVKSACGVSYEALGMAVAKQWNFPAQICEGLRRVSRNDLQNAAKPLPKLSVLANFVKDLSVLIQNKKMEQNDQDVQDLIDHYKVRIRLSKRKLENLIKASMKMVERHMEAMDFNVADSSFLCNLSDSVNAPHAPSGDTGVAEEPNPASYLLTDGMTPRAATDGQPSMAPTELIMDGIQEISQAMMAAHDVNDIALMSLEILYRSLAFDRALMFIHDGGKKRMSVRFGYGQNSQHIIRKVGFAVTNAKDLFNLSVEVGKDLIVADAHDPQLGHLIPRWYRDHINAPAFIFLPVTVQKVTIGALYADRKKTGPPINETEHRHLSMLRNQLVLAIRYRQGGR